MALIPKSRIDPVVELVNQNSSRYSLKRPMTEIVDYNSLRLYNYPWECKIQDNENNVYIELTASTRLDTLANDYYGDPKFWWAIAQINNIKNPLTELKVGMLIKIPPLSALMKNGVTR